MIKRRQEFAHPASNKKAFLVRGLDNGDPEALFVEVAGSVVARFDRLARKSASKSAAYTTDGEGIIFADPTGGAFTITISSADIAVPGREITIQNVANLTTVITIATEGAELINGAATVTINTAYGAKTLRSNGSNLFAV
jgi:hypothetical protein